jgi:hydroxymethylbilane synthase
VCHSHLPVVAMIIRIGARKSALSLKQVEEVRARLAAARPDVRTEIVIFTTEGDRRLDVALPAIGGKGVFTEEIEQSLRDGEIDLAIHSLKDLPVASPAGIVVAAVPERAAVEDVLVSRNGGDFDDLPQGATVGTSSTRRAAQLRRARADLRTESIRGNVDTRLRKAADPLGPFDAIVLAQAGLDRLGLLAAGMSVLPLDLMLPAPGQGALAIQCRDDDEWRDLVTVIDHPDTHRSTAAERAFLSGLGGGCSAPVAAHAVISNGMLTLRGRVLALDGSADVDTATTAPCSSLAEALAAGTALAREALMMGADALLDGVRA